MGTVETQTPLPVEVKGIGALALLMGTVETQTPLSVEVKGIGACWVSAALGLIPSERRSEGLCPLHRSSRGVCVCIYVCSCVPYVCACVLM